MNRTSPTCDLAAADSITSKTAMKELYPLSIVWTPIPLITWILPFVGHMGICDSTGVIHDFAGPYFVSRGNMAFGNPTRTVRIRPSDPAAFDQALAKVTQGYHQQMYNFFCNNCHSFVAHVLQETPPYNKQRTWTMVHLALWVFFCGRFVSFGRALYTLLPFCILVLLIGLASSWAATR